MHRTRFRHSKWAKSPQHANVLRYENELNVQASFEGIVNPIDEVSQFQYTRENWVPKIELKHIYSDIQEDTEEITEDEVNQSLKKLQEFGDIVS